MKFPDNRVLPPNRNEINIHEYVESKAYNPGARCLSAASVVDISIAYARLDRLSPPSAGRTHRSETSQVTTPIYTTPPYWEGVSPQVERSLQSAGRYLLGGVAGNRIRIEYLECCHQLDSLPAV